MKIAIVTLAVAFENEKGYSRFRSLAEILSQKYQVDIITSSFQHWEKKQRDVERLQKENVNKKYNIKFAYEPGYKKNVDLRRIFSHKVAVKNILKILKENAYDVIYCIIPDNSMAACVGEYAKKNNIKFIVDIEDLWPEAMEMVSPFPNTLNQVLFSSWRRDAQIAYEYADAFVGTSDEYRDVPSKKYHVLGRPAITVYVGCDMADFDEGVNKHLNNIIKAKEEFWITYAGNLGSSYDIPTLIKAAQNIYSMGYKDIKVKILGGGPLENEFKMLAQQQACNVEFVGYTPYQKMAAYLYKSDILINSFVKKAPQSIVTKIGDYLAAGKPMINTLSSPEFCEKVEKDEFGYNVEAENEQLLAELIVRMYGEPDVLSKMGRKAREIGEIEFDRKTSYLEIVRLIEKLF